MTPTGRLLGIAIHTERKGEMHSLSSARITCERGVDDDFRGKPGRRQVTVITREAWDLVRRELAEDLPWTARRANLLVEGTTLAHRIGYDLHVGDAILTITGETRPCERMNEIHPGLLPALQPDWRAGVTCRVRRAGAIHVGAAVTLRRNVARQWAIVAATFVRKAYKRTFAVLQRLRRVFRTEATGAPS